MESRDIRESEAANVESATVGPAEPENRQDHGHSVNPEASSPAGYWGLDAALGAAALVGKVGAGVTGAVTSSPPAKFAGSLTQRLVAPLSRYGSDVRSRVADGAGPAVGDTVRRFTPGVIDAVDLNGVLAGVDVDDIVSRVDVNNIVGRVDLDVLMARVDVGALLERVDLNELMGRVDLGALLERVDLNALLSNVDLNALLANVDLNALLLNVDLNALLGGVDMEALLSNMDINAVVDQVDIDALVRNTELGAIIAQSTSGVASEALDVARSQGVGIDNLLAKLVDRMLRRDSSALPDGPPLLVGNTSPAALTVGNPLPESESTTSEADRRPGE